MFTGIIGALGTVESVQPVYDAQGTSTGAAYITINAGDIVSDLDHGGSLAVNRSNFALMPWGRRSLGLI